MSSNLTVELATAVFDDGSEEPCIVLRDGDQQWPIRLNHAVMLSELDTEDLAAYYIVVDTIEAFLERRVRGGMSA